jgi:hypothetical protein
MDGWAGVFAVHVDLWRWGVVARIASEDHVPFVVEEVQFWGPEVGRVVLSKGRIENYFSFCGVPIPRYELAYAVVT